MKPYRIALYPGDGIGIDVTTEAVKVLRATEQRFGFQLAFTEFNWGHRYWHATGHVAPDDFLDQLRPFDAILLGAVGDPGHLPDHITLKPLITLRQSFDQYVCLRPAQLLPGVATPLANKSPTDIDMLVVRENSEGEYIDVGGFLKPTEDDEVSVQAALHTRKGVERILRYSFESARKRRQHLTMATKSNAWKYGMVMWDRILTLVAPDYPDVRFDKCHIDALCMNFVRQPEFYDVVVGSNLFGDILSDLAGAIVGSLGLAPSANINPERNFPSLFEPVHGSAPDIAGKGIANPIAAIRSAAMMLDFLGMPEPAHHIDKVVFDILAQGHIRTPDLGGTNTTTEVGNAIAQHI